MANVSCGTCRFWYGLGGGCPGECRVNPPTVSDRLLKECSDSDDSIYVATVFPMTRVDEWCGSHEPRKEA